jgi:hypothetical protein
MAAKIGLFVASLSAAFALAFALNAAGFAPGSRQAVPASSTVSTTAAPAVAPVGPSPTPQVQVDTVYVAPPVAPKTITVHKIVPSAGGEGGSEGPGGND